MKYVSILAVLISLVSINNINAQCNGRYNSEVFQSVITVIDVEYGESITDIDSVQKLYMDVYLPDGDTVTNRPLVIFCHQGGFFTGSKADADMVSLCTGLAKMGYVTASIDYRLMTVVNFDADTMTKSVFRGLQDGKAAIRFFRKDADSSNLYKINPDAIFFAGASAGSVLALHLTYMRDTTQIPTHWQQLLAEVGGLEGTSGNPGYSTDVLAVCNYAGGLADTSWILEDSPPLFSSHAEDDLSADYDYGPPYQMPGLPTQNLPALYGASLLNKRAYNIGLHSVFASYTGDAHPPYKGFPEVMDSTIVYTSRFLYSYVPCNPYAAINEPELIDNNVKLAPNPSQQYTNLNIKLNKATEIEYSVFDISGKQLVKNNIGKQPEGQHQFNIDVSQFNNGIYFLSILTNNSQVTKKLIVQH